ncbi:MAG TPA: FecR family protein [Caulobacteraceae bacterium]|jgi:hypothetical protein
MRAGILGALALTAMFMAAGHPAHAEPGTPICQLPQYRGTPIYNKYCGGGQQQVAPAEPYYDPARSFLIPAISSTGEFRVVKQNGRVYTGAEMLRIPIEMGDIMETGPTGTTRILLPDETVFTLGPDSEMTMDEFIWDPSNGAFSEMLLGCTKGALRFVTGKVSPQHEPKIKMVVGTIGIRGTDVEIESSPDGTGFVKLHSGSAVLTPYDTDTTIEMRPGQMLTWTDFTNMHGPMPIQ